jgi:DNA polymerase III sliding clamp (beta) subunit (PCNA family)
MVGKSSLSLKMERLKKIIDLLSIVQDEVRLKLTDEGVSTIVVNPAHTFMMELEIKPSAFDFMNYTEDDLETEYGLSLNEMETILNGFKNGSVQLELSDNCDMIIYMEDHEYKFELEHIDIQGIAKPKIPNLDSMLRYDICNITPLLNFLNVAGKFTDYVTLSVNGVSFLDVYYYIEHTHPNRSLAKSTLSIPVDLSYVDADGETNCKSMYAIEYLKEIVNGISNITEKVKFEFGTDYPCAFYFDNDFIKGKAMLAPRIESE